LPLVSSDIPEPIRSYLVELRRTLQDDKAEHIDRHVVWYEAAKADSVTLSAGTSPSTVFDLKTAHDGNVYHIDEAAATPGILLIVDFVRVSYFNLVYSMANYVGASSDSVFLELYNWSTSAWNVFDSLAGVEMSKRDHSFIVPDATNYVGLGTNKGKVRLRFNHTTLGDITHDLEIDVAKLYK
jgi:hypothetical protein